MASTNPYTEGREHFLFAYNAPMAFQIHFCLTISCWPLLLTGGYLAI